MRLEEIIERGKIEVDLKLIEADGKYMQANRIRIGNYILGFSIIIYKRNQGYSYELSLVIWKGEKIKYSQILGGEIGKNEIQGYEIELKDDKILRKVNKILSEVTGKKYGIKEKILDIINPRREYVINKIIVKLSFYKSFIS